MSTRSAKQRGGRASTSSGSDASSRPSEVFKDDLAAHSPTNEAFSLTDEEDAGPEELDEECDFVPNVGAAVWVKSRTSERETWYHGRVQASTRSRTVRGGKQGIFYCVIYCRKLRSYFAPLLGEIKPDTPRVRRLLELAGCDVVFE